jgi:MYXO-CTERM domain-containing protein
VKKGLFLLILAAPALIAGPAARAGMVTVSGSGTWNADAPDSLYTAAGASWSFSFDLPAPLDDLFTSSATNFQYLLDGVAVSTTLDSIEFFSTDDGGMFDLNFADGNSLNLYGPQAYSSPDLSLITGVYASNIDINAFAGPPDGIGSGVVTFSLVVPEPSSLASGGLALACLAGLASRSRRRPAG